MARLWIASWRCAGVISNSCGANSRIGPVGDARDGGRLLRSLSRLRHLAGAIYCVGPGGAGICGGCGGWTYCMYSRALRAFSSSVGPAIA